MPSRLISAGSSVTAARIETATTTMAPMAIERIVVESTRNSPPREMITVTPEKATATPDVRSAIARACSGSRPARTSSR